MPTVTQTLAGVTNFDGTAGQGLFSFSNFDGIPRTSRIVINIVAYHAAGGGVPASEFAALYVRVPGAATEQILLGRVLGPQILGPSGDGDVRLCGTVLPRDPSGAHWQLRASTAGKTVTGTVSVDYTVQAYEETITP